MARILPDGYKRLEYIRNTSTAWINPDYSFAADNSYVMDVTFRVNTRSDWARIAGSFTNNSGRTLAIRLNTSKTPVQIQVMQNASYNSNEWVTADIELNEIVNVHVEYNNSSVNGVPLEQKANTGTYFVLNFGLFSNTNTRHFRGDIFGCYLMHDGEMVFDFVPCISPDGTVGMYDCAGGVFYKSASDADFESGPVIYD